MVFKLIRTMLGLESSDSSGGTDVTVERESREDAAGSTTEESGEGAAGSAEAGSAPTSTGTEDVDDESQEEAAAAGTDAAASTGSMTEEPPEPDAAAEPAEAAGPTSDEGTADESGADPVENVSGIGPAYADRLSEAGVETVDQLLAADPEELAADTDLSAKRIGRWQERAEEL